MSRLFVRFALVTALCKLHRVVVEPLTLVRFAELTARLERCESRQRLLEEEGLPLKHWLSEQRRWLEEMAKRVALNRPRLFQHYCGLVEAERERLGLPPRIGASPSQGPLRRVSCGADQQQPTGQAPPTSESLELSPDIPEYLRAPDPLAQPFGAPLPAVPTTPVTPASATPTPLPPLWSSVPEPQAMGHSGLVFVPAGRSSSERTPVPPMPEATQARLGSAAGEAKRGKQSEPPRLAMAEYAQLTVLLERSSMAQAEGVLARYGLDIGEWFDEVAYWNRQFSEKRVDPQGFERILALQRGKSA